MEVFIDMKNSTGAAWMIKVWIMMSVCIFRIHKLNWDRMKGRLGIDSETKATFITKLKLGGFISPELQGQLDMAKMTKRLSCTTLISRCPLAVIWCLVLMSREVKPTSPSDVTDARLVNGESRCSGHLQMNHQGQWRTLNFRLASVYSKLGYAQVVCRQLGCGSVVSVKYHTNTTVPKPAWELYFSCRGSEETIRQCKETASRKKVQGIDSSFSSMEVVCSEVIRLVNSYGTCSGKVMMRSNERWFPVCESDDAVVGDRGEIVSPGDVMCRELGCGSLRSVLHETLETGVSSKTLRCISRESRLEECEVTTHSNCKRVLKLTCTNPNSMRLVGGENHCRGVLEVKNGPEWRPLEDHWSSLQESQLINICERLGCGTFIKASRLYLEERQPTWEMSYECRSSMFCREWRDGESHYLQNIVCAEAVRLVSGRDRCTGFIEIKSEGSWFSMCQSQLTSQNGFVACRDLGCGFPHEYKQRIPDKFVSNTLNFDCSAEEENLLDCPTSSTPAEATNNQCNAAFLSCQGTPMAPTMTMVSKEGLSGDNRMNVYRGHRVLILCSISAPYKVSSFVLKFYHSREIISRNQTVVDNSAHFTLDAAEADDQGQYDCSYNFHFSPERFSESAAYRLSVKDADYVRLVGGGTKCLGTLEVHHQDEWRPVSQHQSWSLKEAAVVCRQLGCGSSIQTQIKERSEGPRPVWRFYSDCDGSEGALLSCGAVKEWFSTSTIEVLCSDILPMPNITVFADKTYREETDHFIVYKGHSFFINCSVEAQFPGGNLTLGFNGETMAQIQTAVNHSAIFTFNSVNKAASGNYTCVYQNTVSNHSFTFMSKTIAIIVEESRDVKLDDGVKRDDNSSACSGKLLVRKGMSEMKMVTAETSGWDMTHASIVCGQLGCGHALSTSKIQLPKLTSMWRFYSDCDGSETVLVQCVDLSEWFSSTAIQVVCVGRA